MESLYIAEEKGFWNQAPVKTKAFFVIFVIMGLLFSAELLILLANILLVLIFMLSTGRLGPLLNRVKPFFFFSLFIMIFHSLLNPANETTWWWFGWEGFLYGATVALRLLGIIVLAQLFLIATPPGEIFRLFSSYHKDLGLIMLLLVGFLPVLREEMTVTMQAQQTRGLSWESFLGKLRAYLVTIIPVIIKSLYRAQGMASLLYLRGYGMDHGKQIQEEPIHPVFYKGYKWLAVISFGFFIVNLSLLIIFRFL